jgi:broad specificity phosphatase PhoE
MPVRILLVRHGQSEWNALGRWQGQADPPLSDLGRLQAHAAAHALGAVGAVFASDLVRAAETAAIIAAELGVGPVVIDADLRERDAGEWSGLTRAEIDERYPGYLPESRGAFAPRDRTKAEERRPPGWESDESLLDRALAAISRIETEVGSGDVLAVTHGGLIYTVEGYLGQPFDRLANGAGRWIDVDGGQLTIGERVLLVTDEAIPATIPNQI